MKKTFNKKYFSIYIYFFVFVFFLFSINSKAQSADDMSSSTWNNLSVKIYCGVNSILKLNEISCENSTFIINQKLSGEDLNNNFTSEIFSLEKRVNELRSNISSILNQISPNTNELIYIRGEKGEQGPQGIAGPKGETVYINNSTNTFSQYTPVSIAGATGPAGENGKDGSYITNIIQNATDTIYYIYNPNTDATSTIVIPLADYAYFNNVYTENLNTENATITNLNINTFLENSLNILTSNIGGSIATTSIINENIASSTENYFQTFINGIASNIVSIINSFTQSVSDNILTTTINGVVATTTIINQNSIEYIDGILSSNINGIVSTTTIDIPATGISLNSLSATAPLSYDNTSGIFSISKSSSSSDGYLSSIDWNIFNNKQNILTANVDYTTPAFLSSNYIPYTGATGNIDLGVNTLTTASGLITTKIYPATDSTTAFQINKADGVTNIFNVDTTNQRIGIGTASDTLGVKLTTKNGANGFPLATGNVQTYGAFRVIGGDNAVLDMGVNSASGAWIQSTNKGILSTNYPLLLNPNGGNVGIGTTAPTAALHVVRSNGTSNPAILEGALGVGSISQQERYTLLLKSTTSSGYGMGFGFISSTDFGIQSFRGINNAGNLLLNYHGGNVSIGAVNPTAKLSLKTDSSTTGNAFDITNSSSTNLLTVLNSGNIGIGINNPTKKLSVGGGIIASAERNAQIHIETDAGNWPVLTGTGNGLRITTSGSFTSDNGSIKVYPQMNSHILLGTTGTGILTIGTDGVERLRVDSSGNVGIGTTTPTEKLHVSGNILASGTILGSNLSGTNTGDQDLSSYLTSASASSTYQPIGNYLTSISGLNISTLNNDSGFITSSALSSYIPYTGATGNIDLGNNNLTVDTNTLFVDSVNDRVGVGTTNPTKALTVLGDISVSTNRINTSYSAISGLNITNHQSYTGSLMSVSGTNGTAYFGVDGTGAWGISDGSALINANTASKSIIFATQGVEKMRITSGGNVGIGNATPTAALHVVRANGTSNPAILEGAWGVGSIGQQERYTLLLKSTTSSGYGMGFGFISSTDFGIQSFRGINNAGNLLLNYHGGNVSIGAVNPTAKLSLKTDSSTTGNAFNITNSSSTNLLTVLNSGNVGIGTTTPTAKLDVAGMISVDNAASGDVLKINNGGYINFNNLARFRSFSTNFQFQDASFNTVANIAVGGNNTYFNTTGGKVGIGTTNPESKFHVFNGANGGAAANSIYDIMTIENNNVGYFNFKSPDSNRAGFIFSDSTRAAGGFIYTHGDTIYGAGTTDSFIFSTGGFAVPKVIFKGTGDVGILTGALTVSGSGNSSFVGSVGIGTTAPTAKLSVTGDQYVSDGLGIGTLNNNVRAKFTAFTNIAHQTAGMFINSNNSTSVPGGYNYPAINLVNTNTTNDNWIKMHFSHGTDNEGPLAAIAVQIKNHGALNGDLAFFTSNTNTLSERMRILSNGNVGIGTNSPEKKLDVRGTLQIKQTTSDYLIKFGDATGGAVGSISHDSSGGIVIGGGPVGIGYGESIIVGKGGDHAVTISTNSAERMRILSNGNLGIGITSPTSLIHVSNTYNTSGSYLAQFDNTYIGSGSSIAMRVKQRTQNSSAGESVGFVMQSELFATTQNSSSSGIVGGEYVNLFYPSGYSVNTPNSTGLRVRTPVLSGDGAGSINITNSRGILIQNQGGASMTNSYGLYIESQLGSSNSNYSIYSAGGDSYFAGNVGIGITSPSYKLSVSDTAIAGIIGSYTNSDGTCTLDPGDGSWSCSSDETLKKDIKDSTLGLNELRELRPVTFRWLSEDATASTTIGLIAQEVREVFPTLVHTQIDGKLSLNYGGFTPIIIKSIQDLDIKIDSILDISLIDNEESFTFKFFNTLKGWFGNISNGIEDLFAKKVHTEKLCIKKSDGNEICINGDELENIMNNASNYNVNTNNSNQNIIETPAQDEVLDDNTNTEDVNIEEEVIINTDTNDTVTDTYTNVDTEVIVE